MSQKEEEIRRQYRKGINSGELMPWHVPCAADSYGARVGPSTAPSPSRPSPFDNPTASVSGFSTAHTPVPEAFQPDENALSLLEMNGIPRAFSMDPARVRHFVMYWQERGDTSGTWQSKYINWVINNWHRQRERESQARGRDYGVSEVRDVSWMNTGIRYGIEGEDF
jgi:hypothetical protein